MTELEEAYRRRYEEVLVLLADEIALQLQEMFKKTPRIDRVAARAKTVDKFLIKAQSFEGDEVKYSEPLNQIQDQIGARIITYYKSDVERVGEIVEKYYRAIESQDIVPDSEWEFGYFGKHYVLLIPSDLVDSDLDPALVPEFFELQVKTLFQHAWSEANHDLGYKPESGSLTRDENRQLAFTSAQAWGADQIFEELFQKRSNDA